MIDTQWPHRRYNLLVDEWVLCSPQRTYRPWQGQVEPVESIGVPQYDPGCYLCPGNERAGSARNPQYTSTFIFDNDFSALLPDPAQTERVLHCSSSTLNSEFPDLIHDAPPPRDEQTGLLRMHAEHGICRVICFSPRHDLTIPCMDLKALQAVVDAWAGQVLSLGAKEFVGYVQVFENKGTIMGCSNLHPHCQVWATERIPTLPARKLKAMQNYFQSHHRDLVGDYLQEECRSGDRLVCENEHWLALVPFWAYWPYETMLIPRRRVPHIPELTQEERAALADILKRLTTRYDNLFQCSFPYSMGWHGRPTVGNSYDYWRLHAVFYPPLLRSATVRKFAVGYELTGEPQRDITAEMAAARLREMSERHYLGAGG
ncbi:MAG TPA: UDP-glucose--hexose-1-phosphate uridylyltransferase [Acidobacteriota bacterium]|jgi:UDPglucose--hexose-1-phosphate uridylyltransferase|nr:UDP-glucose--hexose-1-phosphate uridylyltransferase [Acidobacteriota bacterium]